MSLIKRLQQITLSQKQWAGISGTLLAALVVAVLVLPPDSPVSLTTPGDTAIQIIERPASVAETGSGATQPVTPEATPQPTTAVTAQPTPTPVPSPRPTAAPASTPTPTALTPSTPPDTATDASGPAEDASASSSTTSGTTISGDAAVQDETDVDALIAATNDPQWSVRWDAVNALGNLGDVRGVPALAERALRDDNPHPRWRSLWALSAVEREGDTALPILFEGLESAEPDVVLNAAVALAFFSQPEARPRLLAALEDSRDFRRWEAVFSLKQVMDSQVTEAFIQRLDESVESDPGVRGEAALGLRVGEGPLIVPALLSSLRNDSSPKVRWRAAMTLGSIGDPALVEELEQVLETEFDPSVREFVEEAITDIKGS